MTPVGIEGFINMTAMSSTMRSRPFDVDHDGFVIAEGAAVLLLRELALARARGAVVYGEVLGSANTADAYHITAPNPGGDGAIACMELALRDAGLQPSDIVHVNAHATGTSLNDSAEATAINKVFGRPGPVVTATKGVTGHALGASGALEAAAVLLAMNHRQLPPTAGAETLDPTIDLDVVLAVPVPGYPAPRCRTRLGSAVTTAASFSGSRPGQLTAFALLGLHSRAPSDSESAPARTRHTPASKPAAGRGARPRVPLLF